MENNLWTKGAMSCNAHILPASNFFDRDSYQKRSHKSKTSCNLDESSIGTPHKRGGNLLKLTMQNHFLY